MGGAVERAFGCVLRDLRLEAGWSQEKLAAASSTTRGYISLLERGVNSVTIDMLFRVAGALRITPAALLERVQAAMNSPAEDASTALKPNSGESG